MSNIGYDRRLGTFDATRLLADLRRAGVVESLDAKQGRVGRKRSRRLRPGAVGEGEIAFLARGRARKNRRAERLGDGDHGESDTARGARNENPLSGFDPSPRDECPPGRNEYEPGGCGVHGRRISSR